MLKRNKLACSILLSAFVFVLLWGCGASKGSSSAENASDPSGMPYPVTVRYIEAGGDGEGHLVEDGEVIRTYTFDDKGNPVSCTKTDMGFEIEDTYENSYRDDGTLEKVTGKVGYYDEEMDQAVYLDIMREYDEQERMITKMSDGWTNHYAYNPDGTMKSMEYFTEGGEADKTVLEYTYEGINDLDLSKIAKVKGIWYSDSHVSDEFDDRIITYNNDGYVSKVEFVEADGIPYWEFDYEIEDGLVTKVSQHYEDMEYYIYSFEYDKSGSGKTMSQEAYLDYINSIYDDVL